MRVKDIMTASVDSIESTDTIANAARRMAEDDVGALPILSDGELVGIVTDRDIAVRGVAAGISPQAPIRRVMSENVATCSPEDDIETVLADETGLPVKVADAPMTCVANGAGRALEDPDYRGALHPA